MPSHLLHPPPSIRRTARQRRNRVLRRQRGLDHIRSTALRVRRAPILLIKALIHPPMHMDPPVAMLNHRRRDPPDHQALPANQALRQTPHVRARHQTLQGAQALPQTWQDAQALRVLQVLQDVPALLDQALHRTRQDVQAPLDLRERHRLTTNNHTVLLRRPVKPNMPPLLPQGPGEQWEGQRRVERRKRAVSPARSPD
jgi:hypothetical protein